MDLLKASTWNFVCGRFINFKKGRKCLTLLTFGCPTHHFRKTVPWHNNLLLWHNKELFYRWMSCFIHSLVAESVLCCCVLHDELHVRLCEGYLVGSQYFRKFHSQLWVKTRHMNTDQSSLISRSTGVAYLWYLFVTPFVLIPTFNTHLYLRQYLQKI